jgi:hypothetical protein
MLEAHIFWIIGGTWPGRSNLFFSYLSAIGIQRGLSESIEMRLPPPSFLLSLFVALNPLKVRATWDNSVCPIVKLQYGSFQGKVDGGLIQYLGIPFAAPPYAMFSLCS